MSTPGKMALEAEWGNQERVLSFLGNQLRAGRIALVLGAGVSMNYGLPDWRTLLARAFADRRLDFAPLEGNLERAASELLRRGCAGDRSELAVVVQRALYDGFTGSFEKLREKPLLEALGALAMVSARGSVKSIISFNFDDVLERYLWFHGFSSQTIAAVPTWETRDDVRIYHPHASLPLNGPPVGKLILTALDYDEVFATPEIFKWWRSILVTIMSSNTCLFVGLSGQDANLRSLLTEVNTEHVGRGQGDAYWGVRFASRDDGMTDEWRERGVCQYTVEYDKLHDPLLRICQSGRSA